MMNASPFANPESCHNFRPCAPRLEAEVFDESSSRPANSHFLPCLVYIGIGGKRWRQVLAQAAAVLPGGPRNSHFYNSSSRPCSTPDTTLWPSRVASSTVCARNNGPTSLGTVLSSSTHLTQWSHNYLKSPYHDCPSPHHHILITTVVPSSNVRGNRHGERVPNVATDQAGAIADVRQSVLILLRRP